ncbi:hypothetical protein QWY28_17410 [Nocardioides sp. SOB77]|uniref:DUF2746 domain-containing protein n=1 Tax=Nocardioides oceani TaxID=3058369 RepID=A0ABT8FJ84_9ACTN|nr:hypothetical protein [Nocardioides oceani]MDN4174743.1 hypothetical protein [Nocardioides oceani]
MPTDPSAVPSEIFTGPYGFLGAIVFFLWLAARELRRARQIDVDTYKSDIASLRELIEQRDSEHKREVADLTNSVEDLKADLSGLRRENLENLDAGARREEALIREIGALRGLLAANGIDTSSVLPHPKPSTGGVPG